MSDTPNADLVVTLDWEEPSPSQRAPTRSREILAQLKEHPGRWACIERNRPYPSGGCAKTLKRHGCEVTVRVQPDGLWTIYARWPKESADG